MKRYVAFLLVVFAVAGCMRLAVDMTGLKQSKYSPLIIDRSEYEEYLKLVEPQAGNFVSDELGDYYFAFSQDRKFLSRLFISKNNLENLRNLLAHEYGLLEPVYFLDSNFELTADWELTEKLRDTLVQSGFENILPMEDTKRYHELILKKLLSQIGQNENTFSQGMFDRVYDENFYNLVLQPFSRKATYLITSNPDIVDCYLACRNKMKRLSGMMGWDKQKILKYCVDTLIGNYPQLLTKSSVNIMNFDVYKSTVESGHFDSFIYMAYTTDIAFQKEMYSKHEELTSPGKAAGEGLAASFAGPFGRKYFEQRREDERAEREKTFFMILENMKAQSEMQLEKNLEFLLLTKDLLKISGSQKSSALD